MPREKFTTTNSITLSWPIRKKGPVRSSVKLKEIFHRGNPEQCWRLITQIALESVFVVPLKINFPGMREQLIEFVKSLEHVEHFVFKEMWKAGVFGVGTDGIKIRVVAKKDDLTWVDVQCDLQHEIVSFTVVERAVSIGND